MGAIRKVEGKRNAAVVARIPVTVEAGYHVNSNAPLEDYLIPLKVAWNSTGALEGGEVIYPKASTANFKVAAGAPAGPVIAAGKLSYQACNAKMCFRPATVEISIPYQVD